MILTLEKRVMRSTLRMFVVGSMVLALALNPAYACHYCGGWGGYYGYGGYGHYGYDCGGYGGCGGCEVVVGFLRFLAIARATSGRNSFTTLNPMFTLMLIPKLVAAAPAEL